MGTGYPRRYVDDLAVGCVESVAHCAEWAPLVAHCTISTHVAASPDHVFALWTNVERRERVGGVTGVSDVSGQMDQVGTTNVVH